MRPVRLKHFAALLAALSLGSTASAQYIWVNESGVKQYSDMPPPASVSKSRILKEPGAAARTAAPADTPENGKLENSATKAKAPMSTAEKNADFNRRRAEQAEKEKKAEQQAKLAADKAKNCERAREYHQTLASGERLARVDKNGERALLSDEQRARELQDVKRVMADCK